MYSNGRGWLSCWTLLVCLSLSFMSRSHNAQRAMTHICMRAGICVSRMWVRSASILFFVLGNLEKFMSNSLLLWVVVVGVVGVKEVK